MLKNTKNLGLVALLSGLTSCVSPEYNDYGIRAGRSSYYDSLSGGHLVSSPVSTNSANYSLNASVHGPALSQDNSFQESSAKIGPFALSSSFDEGALHVKVPYFPAIEIPFHSQGDYGNRFYAFNFDDDFDGWMVGGESSHHEQQPVPISFLGRVVKDFLWRSDFVRPLRKLGDGLDSLSDTPASFIFGKGSKSQIKLKLDSERFGVGWKVMNGKWDFSADYQENIGNGDYAAIISIGFQIGPERVDPLYNR